MVFWFSPEGNLHLMAGSFGRTHVATTVTPDTGVDDYQYLIDYIPYLLAERDEWAMEVNG